MHTSEAIIHTVRLGPLGRDKRRRGEMMPAEASGDRVAAAGDVKVAGSKLDGDSEFSGSLQ